MIIMNKDCEQCAMRADSLHVRHAIVEVPCVNVVIGVVVGELLVVVRVVPVFLVCDAVVHRTLVLIAIYRSHCFYVAVSVSIFLYWRYSVYIFRASQSTTLHALVDTVEQSASSAYTWCASHIAASLCLPAELRSDLRCYNGPFRRRRKHGSNLQCGRLWSRWWRRAPATR